MRFNALAGSGLAALAAAFTLTACSGSTPSDSTSSAPATSAASAPSATSPGSTAARTGTFKGDNGKNVAGTASVSDGKIVLSGFSSDAGPDLHIYLTNGTGESDVAAGKQLGSVAYDQASQTFSTNGADISKYSTVVIHCDKAKATFGDAALS